MAIGPVQLIVLGFNHPEFHGEIIAELERLRERDTVRVIDSLAVHKDADGQLEVKHLSNLSEQEAIELGSKVGALIGLGIAGEEGAEAGAAAGAEQVEAEGIDVLGEAGAWDVLADIPNDSPALIMYTSGTTGRPKGAVLTHTNLTGQTMTMLFTNGADTNNDVGFIGVPLFHIAGSGWSMVGLFHGCQTIVLRDVDPARILQVIPEFGITNALFVPAVIQFLLVTPGIDETDFSTLRAIVYGASPITDAVLTKAMEVFGCDFVQVYGMTETTGAIFQLDPEHHDPVNRPGLLRSCGKPYPWVEMRLVDPELVHHREQQVGHRRVRRRLHVTPTFELS